MQGALTRHGPKTVCMAVQMAAPCVSIPNAFRAVRDPLLLSYCRTAAAIVTYKYRPEEVAAQSVFGLAEVVDSHQAQVRICSLWGRKRSNVLRITFQWRRNQSAMKHVWKGERVGEGAGDGNGQVAGERVCMKVGHGVPAEVVEKRQAQVRSLARFKAP